MSSRNRSNVRSTIRQVNSIVPELSCSFSNYKCNLSKIENYNYCIRHILNDKTAPYKQCNFLLSTSGRRCHRATSIIEKKDGLCSRHSRQAFQNRVRTNKKKTPPETAEQLLEQLSHHHLIPLTPSHAIPDPKSVASRASATLQYGSEPESDLEIGKDVTSLPRPEDDSELDSADSDGDPLEHAGVFTAEEVTRIYLEKLQKLKSVYVDEFKDLMHIMKDARKSYLQAVKTEKETMCSIHEQPKNTPNERKEYEKLKSLIRYHKHTRKYKTLQQQFIERRKQVTEGTQIPSRIAASPQSVKCIYNEGSWKCGEKCVPSSKYCYKHILHDSAQVLFKACGITKGGDEECKIPIIPIINTNSCVYHTEIPAPLEVSVPAEDMEISMAHESLDKLPPRIIDLNDTSTFVVTELPPDNVMEDDPKAQDEEKEEIKV